MVALLLVVGLAALTAVATGLGVLPVYGVRLSGRGLGALWGISAGTMASIAVTELLAPPARTALVELTVGAALGVVFVIVAAALLHGRDGDHGHGAERGPGDDRGPGGDGGDDGDIDGADPAEGDVDPADGSDTVPADPHHQAIPLKLSAVSFLMFAVLTVHSAPEGVGIGAALRDDAVRGVLVTLAIAVHNVPEGTAVAVGLRRDGMGVGRAFVAAVVTSLPQPLLAPLVYLVAVGPFLPAGMGFAGGAMLALVVQEVAPEGLEADRAGFAIGAVVGVALALGLHFLLPVPAGV